MVARKITRLCEHCEQPRSHINKRYCSYACHTAARCPPPCERCGRRRPTTRAIYCSRTCADAAKKKPRRPCVHCGTETHHWKHRYCSIACKSAVLASMSPAGRFWPKVEKTATCWLWRGAINPSGYGQFVIHGRSRLAHRVAFEFATGKTPPNGLDICHACDVRACVNPDHLFLGTRSDNVRDMMKKGRGHKARGEKGGTSKLTVDAVRIIRADYAAGATMRVLATRFHVSDNAVSGVINRRSWTHVE